MISVKMQLKNIFKKKKHIFLSHSGRRTVEAMYTRDFFLKNGVELISDLDHEETFWKFMEQIRKCNTVIIIVNKAFFKSQYCIYELVLAYNSRVKNIIPIYVGNNDFKDIHWLEKSYRMAISDITNLGKNQKKFLLKKIANFSDYMEYVNRLTSECFYQWDYDKTCEAIYERIYGIKPENTEIEHNRTTRIIQKIKNIDDADKSDWIFFLQDFERCSSFRMSICEEDVFGEREWVLEDYEIIKGSIGYSLIIKTRDENGNIYNIDINDIKDLEFNNSFFSDSFFKYYFHVYDKKLYLSYKREIEQPDKNHINYEIIDKYMKEGIKTRRIWLNYEDNDAFAN